MSTATTIAAPSVQDGRDQDPPKTHGPIIDVCRAAVLDGQEHWPLSPRAVFYRLLSLELAWPTLKNDVHTYRRVCDAIVRGVQNGAIPREGIADTCETEGPETFRDADHYLDERAKAGFQDFRRDLMQTQSVHVEIVAESPSVGPAVRVFASQYRVPATVGRGYLSAPVLRGFYDRFKESGKSSLTVLVVCDLHPGGQDYAEDLRQVLRDMMKIDAKVVRVAVNDAQVREHSLPPAILKGSAGNQAECYEAGALPPGVLLQALTEAIEAEIDLDAFNAERERELDDTATISGWAAVLSVALVRDVVDAKSAD